MQIFMQIFCKFHFYNICRPQENSQLYFDFFSISVGGGSILWKVSHWQPVEKFLLGTSTGPPMDRSMQFELVDKLTLICTESGIDPDKLDELLDTFDFDEKGGAIFVNAVLDFFSTHMKMQE